MDPFTLATGVIGLVSALDGIINLWSSRCVDVARGISTHPELLSRTSLVLSTLQEIQLKVEKDNRSSSERKSEMLAHVKELRIMMSKFQKRLNHKRRRRILGYSKLETDLSSIEKFVSALVQLWCIMDMSQLPLNEILARMLQKLKSMDLKALVAEGVYRIKDRIVHLNQRFKVEGGQATWYNDEIIANLKIRSSSMLYIVKMNLQMEEIELPKSFNFHIIDKKVSTRREKTIAWKDFNIKLSLREK